MSLGYVFSHLEIRHPTSPLALRQAPDRRLGRVAREGRGRVNQFDGTVIDPIAEETEIEAFREVAE